MKIRIAELNIEIHEKHAFLPRFCKDYLAEFENADIVVEATEQEIEQEQRNAEGEVSPGYAESICVYRRIAYALLPFDGFVFHACVLECDGVGYAFAARSGTGKSTHARLWLEVFGDRARIINGDKPIFRKTGGVWHAYGTPWCGKERFGCNDRTPLRALCFIERAAQNSIRPIGGQDMIPRLFVQVLIPNEKEQAEKTLELLDDMIVNTPCYLLSCNKDREAATVAWQGMKEREQ